MFRQSARSFSLAAVICLAATICSGTVYAQKKTPRGKSTRTTRNTPSRNSAAKTRAAAEPPLELERLPPDPSVENADVSITAHVRARSLEFEAVPNPKVEFPGNPARDTVWEAVRENLPTPVEPGVTYRNIGIRLKITSVFRDIDRIVAEALGEVPVTEDTTPAPAPIQAPTNTNPVSKPTTPPVSKPTTPKAGSPDSPPASTPPPPRGKP